MCFLHLLLNYVMNKHTEDLLRMSDTCIFILMYEYFPNVWRNISEARKKMENQHPWRSGMLPHKFYILQDNWAKVSEYARILVLLIHFLTCLHLSILSDCCQVHPASWNRANRVLVGRFCLAIRARMLQLHLGHRHVCSTRRRIRWRSTVPMPIAVLLHADLTSSTITSLLAWCVPAVSRADGMVQSV